jgi:hypothetical protein
MITLRRYTPRAILVEVSEEVTEAIIIIVTIVIEAAILI